MASTRAEVTHPEISQDNNQVQDMNAPILNWKVNLTCYKCGEKRHLTSECPHTGNSAIAQRQQIPVANTQQVSYTGPSLFPATNPTLSQTITAETPITAEIWQILMEQLNKANQENNLLKKGY